MNDRTLQLVTAYMLQPADRRREILYEAHQKALTTGGAAWWDAYEALFRAEARLTAQSAQRADNKRKSPTDEKKAQYGQTWRPIETAPSRDSERRGLLALVTLGLVGVAYLAVEAIKAIPTPVWVGAGFLLLLAFVVSAVRGDDTVRVHSSSGSDGQHIHINITRDGGINVNQA